MIEDFEREVHVFPEVLSWKLPKEKQEVPTTSEARFGRRFGGVGRGGQGPPGSLEPGSPWGARDAFWDLCSIGGLWKKTKFRIHPKRPGDLSQSTQGHIKRDLLWIFIFR